jgi:twinkle protein
MNIGYDHFHDIARVCYESYDPEIYEYPDSMIFDTLADEPKASAPVVKSELVLDDVNEVYENLKKWAEKRYGYTEGNKHKFLLQLACACNRMGLSRYDTVDFLIRDYQNALTHVETIDFEKLGQRVFVGYASQHGTSAFTKKEKRMVSKTDQTVEQMEAEIDAMNWRAGDVIYLDDRGPQMIAGFEKGYSKGVDCHLAPLRKHWSWKKQDLNLIHGIPNHGKTEFILQAMLIKAIKDGDKFAVFSPEQNPPDDFYNGIIHMLVGKSTIAGTVNQMTRAEYDQAMDFVREYFFYLYPENELSTPEYINERFLEIIKKHGVTGCLTDPFNQLDHDWMARGMREDQYISLFLTNEKKFALKHNIYKMIVAHPKGTVRTVQEGWNKGNFDCPTVYDLSGGAMWNNKCDNIMAVYRPTYTTMNENGRVEVRVQKIKKQRLVGVPGIAIFDYHRMSGRYKDEHGNSPLDRSILTPLPSATPNAFQRRAEDREKGWTKFTNEEF